MSTTTNRICSYVHRQGMRAGTKCLTAITTLDPMSSYCSTHYKLKSLSKDRLELVAEQLDELTVKVSTLDHSEQIELITDDLTAVEKVVDETVDDIAQLRVELGFATEEITELSKKLARCEAEQVEMRAELDHIHNLLPSPIQQIT